MKVINSHIQLPNCVLKHFRDENDSEKKVWYLDIPSGQIQKKSAKKLGTAKGYFSPAGEIFWNQELESSLAKLNEKIRQFVAVGSGSLYLSAEDIAVAKRYIKAATIRSNLAYNTMMNSSLTAWMCTDQENHDLLAYIGMSTPWKLDQIFQDMSITVLVNQTERNLVVPRNCYYAISSLIQDSLTLDTLVAPISPRCALLFISNNYPESVENSVIIISNPVQIEKLNVLALKYEYIFNCEFVASSSLSELEYLQHFQQEHRNKLEALKQL